MPKNIFVFNINKTLLWAEEHPRTINQVATQSTWPFYGRDNIHIINQEKIAKIMQEILANGDQIAFLQERPTPEKGKNREEQRKEQNASFLEFCSHEYGLSLRPNSIHFHHGGDGKIARLLSISENQQIPRENVILIDNNKSHTKSARNAGFQTVDVDTNWSHNPDYGSDSTHGRLYIQNLETIVNKKTLFLKIKESLQQVNTSAAKQLLFSKCDTLQELCFTAAIRQKSGIFHPRSTTTTGDVLIRFLNRPENCLLKLELCPQEQKICMQNIRYYALHGHEIDYMQNKSIDCLSSQSSENKAFFSHTNNKNPQEPTLLFNDYFGHLADCESKAATETNTPLN
ncbi:hypothetical protein PsalN5692_01008 [Piscirickettsia salmonis]|uniref:hypothetical protein n=1 Tax=Piscirickettsia salmonis TaxID=1238 RepID=UPI0012B80FD7|nr:hypothetical protein [Piscirickettsia salmonis]QGP49562.1 hypothetical protein PsalN5692_01008 [Piscirickettsia salmonis]